MVSATVRRRRLGSQLRRLREEHAMTCEEVGEQLELSHSTISRIEKGKGGVRARDVRDLLDLYQVRDPEQREAMVALAKNPRERNWWTPYREHLPRQYYAYIDLEDAAAAVEAYEPLVVHGLLQTEAYARATVTGGVKSLSEQEGERLVSARLERQANRTTNRARLWVILDESVLRRVIGSPEVLHDQLQHLLKVSDERTVIQVMPFSAGLMAGVAGPLTVLSFEPEDPPAVYVETMAGDLYIDNEAELDRYRIALEKLRAMAASPEESARMINGAMQELDRS